ncbi:MAG TPA: amino acid adenylation domain-containing protein, partial [Thermoanaerobaculia bacterium]|nr:amino acid adenylation domain-containing protein [Thermoanaerobaculia bacterium]
MVQLYSRSSFKDVLRTRSLEGEGRRVFTFLRDGEEASEALSYAELDLRARGIAARLQAVAAPGERALLLYPPGLEFIAAFCGCVYSGVLAVPTPPPRPNRPDSRLQSIVADSAPRIVLTTRALLARAERIREQVPALRDALWIAYDELDDQEGDDWREPALGPETPAFLQYTSGSTSTPKGVLVSHGNLLHNQESIRRAFGQDESSVVVGWLPLYHDMGLIGNVLQPLYAGASCVLMSPQSFLQRPARWLEAISRYRGTTSGGPNFAYDLCGRAGLDLTGLDLGSWRVAFNGAEPVRADTLERFAAAFAPAGFRADAFYPCYGLAEATLFVAGEAPGRAPAVRAFDKAALERDLAVPGGDGAAQRLVGCGRSWLGQQVAIVRPETGERCAEGQVGEIWVSGPSVARCYWNRAEETAETFGARLAGEGPWLRTGDLGFVDGGELFVSGRLKDLVIIRGRNHYPQDIERTAELSHPGLRSGGAAAFSVDAGGEERLIIVQEVERHRGRETEALSEAIRRAVAEEHEVQVYEVVLLRPGSLPKTSSGKVRRQACRAGYLAGTLAVVGRSALGGAPLVETMEAGASLRTREELLALPAAERRAAVLSFLEERAAALLGRRPEPGQPLTGLGLDSLRAVELKIVIETALATPVPLAELLEGCGTGELADRIAAALAGAPTAEEELAAASRLLPMWPVAPDAGDHPLSVGQRSLWLLDRLAPQEAVYNIAVAARSETDLHAEALLAALLRLAERHGALRASFHEVDGEVVQRIRERPEVDFQVVDAAGWSGRSLAERLGDEAWRPFDLTAGPLLRLRLFTRPAGPSVLLLAVHHIVADFGSLAVMSRELGALYRQETGGPAAALPPLALRYADFVRWQEERLSGPRGRILWDYWRHRLAGPPPDLDLPADRLRPPVQTYRGGARALGLPRALAEGARSLARDQGSTLFATLLALWQAQLGRYAGQEDFTVGSPMAGRGAPELQGLVGYFVNPVALRAGLAGEPTVAELVARTGRTAVEALEHSDWPFALLVERLRPVRDPARPPLFQVMLVMQGALPGDDAGLPAFALGEAGARLALGGVALESVRIEERRAQVDLLLRVAVTDEGLGLSLEFNSDLFDGPTADRMLGHFRTLLDGAVAEPGRRAATLPLLTAGERAQAVTEWNDTVCPASESCLHEMFEAQVRRIPESEALVAGEERLTYGELNARANRLARHLRCLRVGPETRVGVGLERSADLVVALLAVLKAGGAYVPLDPSYPAERLAFLAADSGARLLIARGVVPGELAACGLPVLDLDRETFAAQSAEDLEPWAAPDNLAYLIYTSGSTGRPKAVAIEHRSPVALLLWAREVFTPGELAGVLASTSISFDLSVFELFAPLAWGGRVILARDALALPSLPARDEVTLVNTVPSAMAELLRGWALPPSFTVDLAGEPIPAALVEELGRHPAIRRVFNLYGPSEDTTYSTWARLAPEEPNGAPIGRPVAGTRAHVVDRGGELLPAGVPGELCLGGAGLARGYLGRPELTAERFVPDPFSGLSGARLYRTGDLSRRRPDGILEFLGRFDYQVKVRGFRIELGEIETALASHPAVREAAVLAQEDEAGGRRLVAYLALAPGARVAPGELRDGLRQRLPEPMLPAAFVTLEALPRNANGKLDRRALPRPEGLQTATERSYTAPR